MDYIVSGFIKGIELIFSGDPEVYQVIGLSLVVSFTSVLLASFIGIPLGIYLGLKKFKGKKLFGLIISTFMGIPPVVLGLMVFLFLARRGPLGQWRLNFTVAGMIIAQTLLVLPIIMGNIFNSAKTYGGIIKMSCRTLGAGRLQTLYVLIKEMRVYILIAVITGFGRAISEVGAVALVGGNILGRTRVMTTYIMLNTSMGNYESSIAMGIVLLTLAFIVNGVIYKVIGGNDD